MKTKNITTLIGLFLLAMAVTFAACRKNEDGPGDDLKLGNDNAKVQADMDDILNIVNSAYSETSMGLRIGGGTGSTMSVQSFNVCGASIDTSLITTAQQLTITFDGETVCNGRIRSGSVTARLVNGDRWKDIDARLLLTFNNVKVNYVSTDIEFTYNGTKTITNLTGGLLSNLSGLPNVTHKVRGNITVTFDDGTERNWWIARSNTYDYNAGNIRLTSAGDSIIGNIVHTIGGTNRLGQAFTVQAPSAIVSLEGCNWYEPVSGVRIHKYNNRVITLTFGVDQQGNPGGGSCAYGYKVEWVRVNGNIGSAVIGY